MPQNLGFELNVKANNGNYVPVYPDTIKQQIIGWDRGEVYGPITVTLKANAWVNRQQTVTVQGIQSTDIPFCVKVLSGNQSQMQAQQEAYNLLDPYIGIESLTNRCRFTCTNAVPTIDITVQVEWTR